MSTDAITWAFKVSGIKSSMKFVLLALADNADAEGMAWPSVASIVEKTSLDRKTVLKALDCLEECGFLEDSGLRKGTTKQIKIFRLCMEKLSTEEYQNRNSSKNGTVPFFREKSPKFPHKESQISVERVPNLGHGTIIEPSMNHHRTENTREVSVEKIVSPAVSLAVHLRKLGINANGSNPIVRELAEQGVDEDLLTAAVEEARNSVANPSLKYIVAIVSRWKSDAGKVDVRGASPPKKVQAFDWRDDNAVLAKGRELGLSPGVGESWPEFRSRLTQAIEARSRLQ